jgi:hypothetical protein
MLGKGPAEKGLLAVALGSAGRPTSSSTSQVAMMGVYVHTTGTSQPGAAQHMPRVPCAGSRATSVGPCEYTQGTMGEVPLG